MPEENLSRGTAIIVGAGPGLGMAIARAFAAEGHPVALLNRDHERVQGYATELADGGA
jgi:NADP-dependent 3-hydroxy acid dehydrogenase YdfG